MKRKKLPIGIQTFSKIREEGCYYVDKTQLIIKLIEEGTHYFLSRPRRFGKSLMLDTIAELFEGNKTLFDGLYAEDHWDWSKTAPVLRFNFAVGQVRVAEDLDRFIIKMLKENQKRLGLSCEDYDEREIANCFSQLIQDAHEQTGKKAVILIDEYDKPILDNITKPELAREMREGLRNLYSVIKGMDAHIQFAMLTGVSKFSKVSLFSGLNHLRDITVSSEYSAICGYTDEDVDTVFSHELAGLDREEIRRWYNGYNWTGTSVYNPFDLLLLFKEREFRNYWFETGTPTFLVDLLARRGVWLPELSQLETDADMLSTFDVDEISTEGLMFQSGYLTIDETIRLDGNIFYRLRYPNREVFQSLHASLLTIMSPSDPAPVKGRISLIQLLRNNNFMGIKTLFSALFASIPNDWYRNNPISQYEGYYASVFYSYFASIGLDIRLEDATNRGRIDMTVLFNNQVYIIEFKVVDDNKATGEAMAQLRDRNYAQKYQAHNQPIHLMGIEFSKDNKSVVGFEVETI